MGEAVERRWSASARHHARLRRSAAWPRDARRAMSRLSESCPGRLERRRRPASRHTHSSGCVHNALLGLEGSEWRSGLPRPRWTALGAEHGPARVRLAPKTRPPRFVRPSKIGGRVVYKPVPADGGLHPTNSSLQKYYHHYYGQALHRRRVPA